MPEPKRLQNAIKTLEPLLIAGVSFTLACIRGFVSRIIRKKILPLDSRPNSPAITEETGER
jgi:hypothetical protein